MTTEQMRLAIMWHFRYRLQYPLVATECQMATAIGNTWYGYSVADVLAIKPEIVAEIELKQHRWEIKKDLETKTKKHAFYLRTEGQWDKLYETWEKGLVRPNKFYFAYHEPPAKYVKKRKPFDIPRPYGVIIVYNTYNCYVVKPGRYLHKDLSKMDEVKTKMSLRLVSENITLRRQLREGQEYDRYTAKRNPIPELIILRENP